MLGGLEHDPALELVARVVGLLARRPPRRRRAPGAAYAAAGAPAARPRRYDG